MMKTNIWDDGSLAQSLERSSAGPALLGTALGAARGDLLRDEVLSDLFSATVARRPQATAIVAGGRTWSYRELDEDATAMARGLVRAGVGPGHIVGLWMPRGAQVLIAQIAIAKSGAAWLPFDVEAPVDRIAICLADAGAQLILTAPSHAGRLVSGPCEVVTPADLIDSNDATLINPRLRGLTPAHTAYVIYTSGSTGKPKGVAISHRNICHFLRSANTVYGIGPDDVVFQGASVAFDLSMEEIWTPYLTGASLFVASMDDLSQTDELAATLTAAGVTVLDTVPTLLGMLSGDVPCLRTIILGGEACPAGLIERWSKPGRRIFNSYGPTEATVVATIAELRPGKPVTIGRPIPNYTAYIVDDAMQPLPPGYEGELLLGGPGIACGYLARPELTAQKFIANPFASAANDPLLYRTGDAAAFDASGTIEFRGRIDDQVKIRGFRVELGEIEAAICRLPGVAQAAMVLRTDDGIEQLTAFVRLHSGAPAFDGDFARATLRASLPAYMVPQHFETTSALPVMVSGKLDRKALKALPLTFASNSQTQEDPRTPTEATLLSAAQAIFSGRAIPFDADFFTDLGGHSLLAARFISAIRLIPRFASITLKDMYAERSLRKLARTLDARAKIAAAAPPVAAIDNSFEPVPLSRRVACGLAQAAVLPIVITLAAGQWLSVYVSYTYITPGDASFMLDAATIIGLLAAFQVVNIAIAVAVKWLVLGRTKPGRYPLWGSYYFRYWVVERFAMLAHETWLQGTPFYRYYLRLLGAKIGRDALIGGLVKFEAHDLVSIGADATIGSRTTFATARVEGNEFIIGAIKVGQGATIGSSCVIETGASVGRFAELGDLTALLTDKAVPDFEIWEGSPARKTGSVEPQTIVPPPAPSSAMRAAQQLAYLAVLILVPPLGLIPLIPAFYVIEKLDTLIWPLVDTNYLYYLPLLAWPAAMSSILMAVGIVTLLRWLILPRVQAGTHSVHSWFYLRKWAFTLAIDVVLDAMAALFATVYMRAWYRAMGMKIGKDSEISTSFAGLYDLVEIGDQCFVADLAVVGEEEIKHGWMRLAKVTTGNRVFVGNAAIVPPGSHLGDGSLVGVYSRAPGGDKVGPGETWYGSPAIKLPVRQSFASKGAVWTFEPTRWMRMRRAIFEALNASFPTMCLISLGMTCVEILKPWMENPGQHIVAVLAFIVGMSVTISFVLALIGLAQKWVMMGRYKPTQQPMWSWWALRTESVAVCYDALCANGLFGHLTGTPMLPWALRLFGAKIGKGVYLNSTDITEFDCIDIGDHAAINAGALLQTHLYEDRQMKVDRIKIGAGVTIGPASLVLYDTEIGPNARLAGLTTVMKGEYLPANSNWSGSPAQAR